MAAEMPAREKNFANRGTQLLRLGRYDEAAAVLTEALKRRPDNTAALFDRATAYLHSKLYESAFADFSTLCRTMPDDARVWYNAGLSARYLQKYPLAVAHFDKSLELRSAQPAALMERGYCRYLLKNYLDAERDYAAAVRIVPRNADAWYSLSLAQHQLRNTSSAMAAVSRALQINPINSAYRLQRAYLLLESAPKAIAKYQSEICDSADTRKVIKFSIKSLNQRAGYSRVIADASAVTAVQSENRSAGLLLRGYCYYLSGEYSRAISDFTRVTDKSPEPEAFYYRAVVFAKKGENAKALADINRALQLRPNSTTYRILRGSILAANGKYGEATEMFSAILRTNSQDATVLCNRASAYLGVNNYSAALQDVNRAMELDDVSADLWLQLGVTLATIADSGGLSQYRILHDTLQTTTQTGVEMQISAYQGVDTAIMHRAVNCFSRSIQLRCFESKAYIARASSRFLLQDYEGALADALRAVDLDVKSPDAHIEAGMAYLALRNTKSMFGEFKVAARLAPDNRRARYSYGYALFVRADSVFHAENGRVPLLDSIASAAFREFSAADGIDAADDTRIMLGISCFFLRKYKQSLELFHESGETEAELYYRGLTLAEYGDVGESVTALRKYLAVGLRRDYRNNATALLESLMKQ
ncbi:hypothetical protein MASR2M18_05090 [Ignavibacteria bacterium]